MRAFGIFVGGLAAVALAYLCVDTFILNSQKGARARGMNKSINEMVANPARTRSQASPPRVSPQQLLEHVASLQAGKDQASADLAENPIPPSRERPRVERSDNDEGPDRSGQLAGELDAEYAADDPPTREAYEREKTIETLFSNANLGDKGHLKSVVCRESICRGTVSISSKESDGEVFQRTFLSREFMSSIPDAISVVSREQLQDGTVLATFFIHPQAIFDVMKD